MNLTNDTPRTYHKTPVNMPWYYEAIIDMMISNPDMQLQEIAEKIGRSRAYLSSIVNSDMFKAAYRKRREEFGEKHDAAISMRLAKVAIGSLDAILDKLEKKKDTIPISALTSMAGSALKNLGYGVESPPAASVNLNVNNGTQVVLPATVTAKDIEEARMAVRQHQQAIVQGAATPLLELKPNPQEAEQATMEGQGDT